MTYIPSHSGNEALTITLNWEETNIGDSVKVKCPCGNLTFGMEALFANRYCGGDFNNGGKWSNPDVSQCNFTDLSREICQLLEVSKDNYSLNLYCVMEYYMEYLHDVYNFVDNFEYVTKRFSFKYRWVIIISILLLMIFLFSIA